MITAKLMGKYLLIGGAGVGAGTGAYCIKEAYFSNNKELMKLADKVGLVCKGNPTETFGVECTKKEGDGEKVKVKQGTSELDVSAITGGKIKVYLKSKDEDYKDNFKFVIEDGDISTSDNAKKLEQFETYEIKEEGGKHHLTRKNEASKEIKKALGLPEDTSCNIITTSGDGCTLDDAKLKKIKFEGLVEGEASVNSGTPKLKISKVSEAPFNEGGYKFVLESTQDTKFSSSLTIKKGTNTEFRIKKKNGSLTLEKAWTVKSLGEKVGLICPETVTNGTGKCTLKDGSINVNNGGASETNKKFTGLNKKDTAEKEVKFEIDQEGHSQGIKFFVEDEKDIELQGGSGGTDTNSKKLLKKDGGSNNQISYEIKKDGENWHLTKKTTSTTA